MIQSVNLTFKVAAALSARRFVTIAPGTDTVAYTAEDQKPDGITIAESDALTIAVKLLDGNQDSYFFDAEGVIALGGQVSVGTDGKGKANAGGETACLAKGATVSGSVGTGYLIREVSKPMTFITATDLVARRFVTLTAATGTVAYTVEDAAPTAITLIGSVNDTIQVQMLSDNSKDFVYDVEDTIAAGGVVGVGTAGKGKADNASADACVNKADVVALDIGVGYRV